MTLAEFVAARLDEDEAAARDAFYEGQHWLAEEEGVYRYPVGNAEDELAYMADRKRDADHIVRWQPARVLREVEAKQKILADYERVMTPKPMTQDDPMYWPAVVLQRAVCALAAAYSDHPDYASLPPGMELGPVWP